ncbi:ABC transporter ATP-binding protein [Paenibacillus sp. MER TA 81-3]|uniref:ABC transporter ATP-binding protein n=1 Tax=Paenibacillus sp. MER TA 81-3 TaxID=2939573 RepID=UPI0020420F8A|nr:ABC transporter ATP-binding protein [Paenibacillus sp. MER TA 81-3]MCM3341965.1 ABC transporter ATP-binding protein [Paenibacillus sp. MER TA 81-3]
MSNILEVQRLTKSYGGATAVNEVSFALEQEKIYGLLGRNGAGKTTIMHMITAQLFPTRGEVKVFGENPYENERILSRICFIKESQKYPDTYRVVDVLEVAAAFYPNWDRDYAYALLEDFRLPPKRNMKKLSRGMLSAVGIVVGLASRAPLTIFDEPYLGLDAVSRSLFYDRLIEDYGEHPRTVILSTHLIDEVSQLLEHVLVIDEGKLIMNEDADDLRGRAFTVVGTSSTVDAYTAEKEVINRSLFGGLASATIVGDMTVNDKKQAEALGLELAAVSLQQLIVYLTRGNLERKAVEA